MTATTNAGKSDATRATVGVINDDNLTISTADGNGAKGHC
jgi:uncharacterized protein YaiE (UPF0345 family)